MVIIDTIHSVPLLPRDRAALLALGGFRRDPRFES